jgi:hypothetical protein
MTEPDESGAGDPPPGETPNESVTPTTAGSAVRDLFGCVLGLAILVGWALVMMWGYRAIFGPSAPVPVEAGEVRALELHGGGGSEHAGRKCKVYAEWIAVEADGAVVMIPRERVQSLRLAPGR